MSVQLHAPFALHPGKEPLVPVGYEAGWTPLTGHNVVGERKFLALAGNCLACIIVTILTELHTHTHIYMHAPHAYTTLENLVVVLIW